MPSVSGPESCHPVYMTRLSASVFKHTHARPMVRTMLSSLPSLLLCLLLGMAHWERTAHATSEYPAVLGTRLGLAMRANRVANFSWVDTYANHSACTQPSRSYALLRFNLSTVAPGPDGEGPEGAFVPPLSLRITLEPPAADQRFCERDRALYLCTANGWLRTDVFGCPLSPTVTPGTCADPAALWTGPVCRGGADGLALFASVPSPTCYRFPRHCLVCSAGRRGCDCRYTADSPWLIDPGLRAAAVFSVLGLTLDAFVPCVEALWPAGVGILWHRLGVPHRGPWLARIAALATGLAALLVRLVATENQFLAPNVDGELLMRVYIVAAAVLGGVAILFYAVFLGLLDTPDRPPPFVPAVVCLELALCLVAQLPGLVSAWAAEGADTHWLWFLHLALAPLVTASRVWAWTARYLLYIPSSANDTQTSEESRQRRAVDEDDSQSIGDERRPLTSPSTPSPPMAQTLLIEWGCGPTRVGTWAFHAGDDGVYGVTAVHDAALTHADARWRRRAAGIAALAIAAHLPVWLTVALRLPCE